MSKMLHGWCQLGLTQPKCSIPLLWVHSGRQPDTGIREMFASLQALQLPLAAPWAALTSALTGFQLHTHLALTTGCVFKWGQACPAAHPGRTVCASHAAWRDVVPWEPPSLHRGWRSCWKSRNLTFLDSPRVICLGDRAIELQWVPLLSSYFPWDIPLLCHPHPGTKHWGETWLHTHVSFTAHLCAPTQHYHEKPLLTETKPKLQ